MKSAFLTACSLIWLAFVSLPAADLEVKGEIPAPVEFTLESIRQLPAVTVRGNDHGQEKSFTGVPVHEILTLVKAPQGETLRGANVDLCLLVTATDGYRAVFSLAEFDPAFTNESPILAYEENGTPMPASHGPLRLVLAHEKRQSRWVRQVIRMEIFRAPGIPFGGKPHSSPAAPEAQ